MSASKAKLSKANSAFHPSGVGKLVPASAGKAKAGMVHSDSGWTRGVQVKLWDPLRTRVIPEHLRGVFTTSAIQIYVYLYLYLRLFIESEESLCSNLKVSAYMDGTAHQSSRWFTVVPARVHWNHVFVINRKQLSVIISDIGLECDVPQLL